MSFTWILNVSWKSTKILFQGILTGFWVEHAHLNIQPQHYCQSVLLDKFGYRNKCMYYSKIIRNKFLWDSSCSYPPKSHSSFYCSSTKISKCYVFSTFFVFPSLNIANYTQPVCTVSNSETCLIFPWNYGFDVIVTVCYIKKLQQEILMDYKVCRWCRKFRHFRAFHLTIV